MSDVRLFHTNNGWEFPLGIDPKKPPTHRITITLNPRQGEFRLRAQERHGRKWVSVLDWMFPLQVAQHLGHTIGQLVEVVKKGLRVTAR